MSLLEAVPQALDREPDEHGVRDAVDYLCAVRREVVVFLAPATPCQIKLQEPKKKSGKSRSKPWIEGGLLQRRCYGAPAMDLCWSVGDAPLHGWSRGKKAERKL